MLNTGLFAFKTNSSQFGTLTAIEGTRDIPFQIKRVYYITDVAENVTRGFHSHTKLHQMLICVSGSVKIRLKSPNEEQIIQLNDPSKGIYVGPMVWREMFDFTPGAALMVLASEYYDETDYIRDYDHYQIRTGT